AVHVFDNGVQEEIYLLYIDNVLKYYNGVTDKSNYAFSVSPKPVKIGIRLKHKFIEIDSVYFQPNYKHDLSIDLQHLPANVRVTTAKNYWSDAEVKLIERSMWQFNSNRQFNQSFVWQNKELYPI